MGALLRYVMKCYQVVFLEQCSDCDVSLFVAVKPLNIRNSRPSVVSERS